MASHKAKEHFLSLMTSDCLLQQIEARLGGVQTELACYKGESEHKIYTYPAYCVSGSDVSRAPTASSSMRSHCVDSLWPRYTTPVIKCDNAYKVRHVWWGCGLWSPIEVCSGLDSTLTSHSYQLANSLLYCWGLLCSAISVVSMLLRFD